MLRYLAFVGIERKICRKDTRHGAKSREERTAEQVPTADPGQHYTASWHTVCLRTSRARPPHGRLVAFGTNMRTLLIVAVILAGCACDAATAPASSGNDGLSGVRKASGKEIVQWQQDTNDRFDLKALTDFLKRTIREHRFCDDVDLTKAKLGEKWVLRQLRMTNGDWEFSSTLKPSDTFELRYSPDSGKFVMLKCRRLDAHKFEMISMDGYVVIRE
jgi:hypothetical protein